MELQVRIKCSDMNHPLQHKHVKVYSSLCFKSGSTAVVSLSRMVFVLEWCLCCKSGSPAVVPLSRMVFVF